MSRKLVTKEKKLLDFADASINQTTESTDVQSKDRVHYRVEFSGTPTGTLYVEYSNDDASNKQIADWSWNRLESIAVVVGAGQLTQDILIDKITFKNLRLAYVATAGIGNVDAYVVAVSEGA